MPPIASTASVVAPWMSPIWPAISSVALPVWVASDLTSDATTAKPLPASPARAASMVALSASRLVWLAMSLIRLTTSPIFCAASASPWTFSLVFWASSTAFWAILLDWPTWRPTSSTDWDSSSAAEATVCTLVEASSDAAATAVDWRLVSSAVDAMDCAEPCISVAAEATVAMMAPAPASKSSASSSMALRFSSSALASACFFSSAAISWSRRA